MFKIKSNIPNFLTSLNVLSGVIGIYYATSNNLVISAYCIGIAAIFDFADGFAARMLKATSSIGKELDSLADMVSFGVLPSFIAFFILKNSIISNDINISENWAFIAFIIPSFSAIRLARFNLDSRQTINFIGLPTPAHAIFWAGMVFLSVNDTYIKSNPSPFIIIFFILILSFLLNSNLKFFSLKFKSLQWKNNEIKYVFLLLSIIVISLLNFFGISFIVSLYVVLSFLGQNNIKN